MMVKFWIAVNVRSYHFGFKHLETLPECTTFPYQNKYTEADRIAAAMYVHVM